MIIAVSFLWFIMPDIKTSKSTFIYMKIKNKKNGTTLAKQTNTHPEFSEHMFFSSLTQDYRERSRIMFIIERKTEKTFNAFFKKKKKKKNPKNTLCHIFMCNVSDNNNPDYTGNGWVVDSI